MMSTNLPSTSTDTSPLRFHHNHGKNVTITNDSTIGRRINTSFFTRGLMFSSRPINTNEKISFKLLEVTDNLGGFIYVGFTSRDPVNLRNACASNLANRPGYWSWFFPKDLCNRNTVLFYYVTKTGHVHYGVDNKEKGLFDCKLKILHPLWATIDIFGNSNSIKIVDNPTPKQEPKPQHQTQSMKFVPMMLHPTHGRNVRLSNHCAQRIDTKYNQGYVFTHRPIQTDETVVIQISPNRQARFEGYLHLGVTSCDPASLNQDDLPDDANLLVDRPEYWVLICDFTNLNCCDEISLSKAEDGQFSFHLNGGKFDGVVHVDPSLKLWVFLNVYGSLEPIHFMTCADRLEKEIDKDKECMVCYEKVINTALYRCGHMCMCYDCAVEQWQGKGHGHCPLCRAVIRDVIRINK